MLTVHFPVHHNTNLLFVVLVSKEWLLALGTHEVLHVPLLAKSSDHSFLDWSSASAADGNAHLVMAPQTVQLALDFARTRRQLDAARLAVKVVRVVGLALCAQHTIIWLATVNATQSLDWYLEFERCTLVNDGSALEADVLADRGGLLLIVAWLA